MGLLSMSKQNRAKAHAPEMQGANQDQDGPAVMLCTEKYCPWKMLSLENILHWKMLPTGSPCAV